MESPFDCFITGIKKSVYTFPFQYSVSFVSLWNNCEAFLRNPEAHNPYYYSDSNTAHTFPSYIYTYMPSMWIYIFPLSIVPRFQFLKSSFLYLALLLTLFLLFAYCAWICVWSAVRASSNNQHNCDANDLPLNISTDLSSVQFYMWANINLVGWFHICDTELNNLIFYWFL